jgi:hypothetical protein
LRARKRRRSPPSFQVEILSTGGSVLTVTDGTTSMTLIESGATIDGAVITEIQLGYHPAQVDSAGRLIFPAEFYKTAPADPYDDTDPLNTDQTNIYTAIVIGIPN